MTSANIRELTDDNFDAEVLRGERPTVVDFWATWCAPCRALAPVIDALAEQYRGAVDFGALDVDRHQGVAARYGVRSVPALLLFQGGRVVDQLVGAGPGTRRKLEAAIERAVARGAASRATG